MATSNKEVQSQREHELELIVNELEELNEEARKKDLWIRTKWNLPNQKPWHLGDSIPPKRAVHQLDTEYPRATPHVWKWEDINTYLQTLVRLCPLELTERQSVLLTNPTWGDLGKKVTNTMRIAISIYKGGDIAESHLHSPNASRTILSEAGGYTIVEGERIEPDYGDLIMTPNGTWHEHGNNGNEPIIWADTLDWPLMDYLGASWSRNDEENAVDHGNPKKDFSSKFYGHGGLKPMFRPHHRGSGLKLTPMFHYKASDIRAALNDLRDYDGDPYEGVMIEIVDPTDGKPVFPTISYRAQMLRGNEETRLYRHSASTIYCCLGGSGYTEVDGQKLEWGKNDFFVVPDHRWRRHVNNSASEDAILYSYTDAPLLEKIGHYHAQGQTKQGKIEELI